MFDRMADRKDPDADRDSDLDEDPDLDSDLDDGINSTGNSHDMSTTKQQEKVTDQDSDLDDDNVVDKKVDASTRKATDGVPPHHEIPVQTDQNNMMPVAHKAILGAATGFVAGISILGAGQDIAGPYVKGHEGKPQQVVERSLSAEDVAKRDENQSKFVMIDSSHQAADQTEHDLEMLDDVQREKVKAQQEDAQAVAEQDKKDNMRGAFYGKP